MFFRNGFGLRASLHLSPEKERVQKHQRFISLLTDMFDFSRNVARIEDTENEQHTKKASHHTQTWQKAFRLIKYVVICLEVHRLLNCCIFCPCACVTSTTLSSSLRSS